MADITGFFSGPFDPDAYIYEPEVFNKYDAVLRFTDELTSFGHMIAGQAQAVGSIKRVKHRDDKGHKKDAWYVLYDGGDCLAGCYGHWQEPDTRITWCSHSHNEMTASQRDNYARSIEEAKKRQEEYKLKLNSETAKKAQERWNNAQDVDLQHYYIAKKGINPIGVRQEGIYILVPLYNAKGEITTIQSIDPEGNKKFMFGGEKKGCFFCIPGAPELVLICEGFSTGASLSMASKATVYMAMDAGNLNPVTAVAKINHPDSKLVICADNDHTKEKNTGIDYGKVAAHDNGVLFTYPVFNNTDAWASDFNDYHKLYGLKLVRAALGLSDDIPVYEAKQQIGNMQMPAHLYTPPGSLGGISGFYNGSARMPQPAFAVQAALATVSTILGRNFRTSKDNYSTLYFLNIAKSSTGKEHVKTVIERTLEACDLEHLIAGGGYTSAGAVFSTLLSKPSHIAVIDEMGKYMEAAKSNANMNAKEANKILMEAIGRVHGTLRPSNYSTMSMNAVAKKKADNRKVMRPSMVVVGLTTPCTFYENITKEQIKDGFLGRFIIHNSETQRRVADDPDYKEVPESVINWAAAIKSRVEDRGNLVEATANDPSVAPEPIVLMFKPEALTRFTAFEYTIVSLMNELEAEGIDGLCGRVKEFSMRMSLIISLAENPYASTIEASHAEWAISYMDYHMRNTIATVREKMTSSGVERERSEILTAIRHIGEKGITSREMKRQKPFSTFTGRQLDTLLSDLQGAGLVDNRSIAGKAGRPRIAWVAIDPDYEEQ